MAGGFAWALGCGEVVPLGDVGSTLCTSMCDAVMTNCVGSLQVYETREKCMGVCKLLPVGDPSEPQGTDTVECRLHFAELVPGSSLEDALTHCRSAGPEGVECGGGCQSYCLLYEKACGQIECGTMDNCIAKCGALRDRMEYNVIDDYEGNSLQCRLVHLSNASIVPGGQPHCGHANLTTPTDHCTDLPDGSVSAGGGSGDSSDGGVVKPAAPDCDDYCRVNLIACSGQDAQYESQAQCAAVCRDFSVGEFADTTQNTLGCRLYHSYNALCSPDIHCAHSGPGGEGQCGTAPTDKCASYCQLAKQICSAGYTTTFTDDAECVNDCMQLPDATPIPDKAADARYSTVYAQTPGTVACRFLALARAATEPLLCAGAPFGGGACAP
jgi:hypothetical protein